jgi:hypothetical protein
MRAMPLQLLTWGTVTAAVGSAVWLSNTDRAAAFGLVGDRATSNAMGLDDTLPSEPTRAGPSAAVPGSSAAKQVNAS